MILSLNCVINGNKESRFIKEQETSGLLSSSGIKATLSQISIFGPILL